MRLILVTALCLMIVKSNARKPTMKCRKCFRFIEHLIELAGTYAEARSEAVHSACGVMRKNYKPCMKAVRDMKQRTLDFTQAKPGLICQKIEACKEEYESMPNRRN
ncbi:hypothetical protein CRM22_007369 [Opisthorchis felineus]|uniref:Saposin B-type domain-containing protein n=1 Tax=Opisthorchis felineus TaxID=147828 RepID=A0A4S2LIC5_OPIFE|nr:hypothetical protein CRM22_007369 [Opisthorchis felineus]